MYFDKKRNRILLRDGTSIVSEDEYTRMILKGNIPSGVKVVSGEDSLLYKQKWGVDVGSEIEDIHPEPASHDIEEYDYIELIDRIFQSKRMTQEYVSRVEEELEFFAKTGNLLFLFECMKLIDTFKEDGVVWGVGRGSCCASLVLYLLEVHDINPIRFDIPFEELSKEERKQKWE